MSMTRRVLQLAIGLWLFGFSVGLMVLADLGLPSWDVLHEGVSQVTGIPMGYVVILVSALVMVLWIPIRQRPGAGTVANLLAVGLALEATLALMSAPEHLGWRIAFMVGGVVLNGIGTGLYIGAGFGPGPRDGLMTGLARKGRSIRVVRLSIELTVLVIGWLLGGTVWIGTLLYALAIGPLAHVFIPMFTRSKIDCSKTET
ncbi:MAG TPA: hypothetical protein H9881_13010 [Candidatus Stackebrandtia excrementipullorum]|nr:hypothetical protein [Candidatus Stackebrandtia excrementipullorum]